MNEEGSGMNEEAEWAQQGNDVGATNQAHYPIQQVEADIPSLLAKPFT